MNLLGSVDPVKFAGSQPPDYAPAADAAHSRWAQLTDSSAAMVQSWAPIAFVPAPALARALGITPSRLRRWRSRGKGPRWQPRSGVRSDSNPSVVHYLCADVWAWLDCRSVSDSWEYEARWIVEHLPGAIFGDLLVNESMTQDQVERTAQIIRGLLKYPEFRTAHRIGDMPWTQPVARAQFSLSRPTARQLAESKQHGPIHDDQRV